ncbi:MAG: pyruvate dehydrogenase complex dihydrolipoamide acetyltransferase [Gemmatimonadota bacterium]|nr:pyruvate dehydrogenase complex dihydrolipoamide acetyltransferase [Gemmatimonadota bacterium]MDQ8147937.1 pyruvate dehydrogenase complex dihydrolipoamide acetyltransferase [Gemmatimonadota bacterium]MDQ8149711.1 pyruvate dehydrogenase complex dihydrolipoamide acetyltransferase [Gemmatimonadota bacterium]MDQ8157373.1 pyruvate dehydrogenase complex dihydrolipoamide acetyltransferase [Gemmatimonadota bacterium]MDQ8177189.1 pyruvate dehydrogenase complex dihydrolipoamide acetyltransferase [Gemma
MATKVFMEALSPTMEEGRLVNWLKQEGDAVKPGDVLAEVETDKAVMELAARGEGVLRKQLVAAGTTAAVGTLVGIIAAAGEEIAALLGGSAPAASAPSAAPSAAPAPAATPVAAPTTPAQASSTPAEPAAPAGRVIASPLARRLAGDSGVNLGAVHGSGPGGRIVKRDIEAAMASGATSTAAPTGTAATAPRAAAPARSGAGFRDEPLTQIRKTIARRLSESIGPIPTFYLTAEFDLSRAAEMRAAAAELGDAYKFSFNDLILKATATALTKHPEVNAHWLGDRIRYFDAVHLGMAVATDDGLIVPVIFDADAKGMGAISAEARSLAKKARERKLKPEEFTGSTFSVSNLGMMQIDQFTAIINPPEVGILAVGAIEDKVEVAADGGFIVRKKLRVTMSCDHRVIDGAVGAAFLQTLRRMVENPLLLAL